MCAAFILLPQDFGGRGRDFAVYSIFVWAVGRAETIVKNPSRWKGMNFAAAAQFTQTTRPYRIYCLANSISAAANRDVSAISLGFEPCTGVWVQKKDVLLPQRLLMFYRAFRGHLTFYRWFLKKVQFRFHTFYQYNLFFPLLAWNNQETVLIIS